MPHSPYPKPNTSNNLHYDYIISGSGAAGLSLLARMIDSGKFTDKKILLVDKEQKVTNDRTWCFWEKGSGFFESIVYKSWPSLWFHSDQFSKLFDISPYRYKMIRGIDFYNHCLNLITSQRNITTMFGTVKELHSDENETFLILDDMKITADYIFNSILFQKPVPGKNEHYLLQHFKGWVIETNEAIFNEEEATLMDFRVAQDNGAAFVYTMPLSAKRALVEFTMFSKQLLEQPAYDDKLRSYIGDHLYAKEYKITAEEFGIIPMTNHRFPQSHHHIINIGTAGGQTKASTGYTFMFIQKNTNAIVQNLIKGEKPVGQKVSGKYHFYDSVLLNVLATGKLPGDAVFTRLFKNRPTHLIFQFLDNDSTLLQDLHLISSLPTIPFLKAGVKEIGSNLTYKA